MNAKLSKIIQTAVKDAVMEESDLKLVCQAIESNFELTEKKPREWWVCPACFWFSNSLTEKGHAPTCVNRNSGLIKVREVIS